MTCWLLTCEHASATIPRSLRTFFSSSFAQSQLKSHLGYDIGAAKWARAIGLRLNAQPILGTKSRLVIDLNRSAHHPRVFSEFTRGLPQAKKLALLKSHEAHWNRAKREIEKCSCRCLHLALHSFTPELDGKLRNADVGLLYDSRRHEEAAFARVWQEQVSIRNPKLRVRRNYPYLGKNDGLPTGMRKFFSQSQYLGFELEINQCWAKATSQEQSALIKAITESLVIASELTAR